MSKQNIGFIAPFALNILAYVLVWNFFFAEKDVTTTAVDDNIPAAYLEEMESNEDGAYIMTKEDQLTAMREND